MDKMMDNGRMSEKRDETLYLINTVDAYPGAGHSSSRLNASVNFPTLKRSIRLTFLYVLYVRQFFNDINVVENG